jgi:hypothetical protein
MLRCQINWLNKTDPEEPYRVQVQYSTAELALLR